MAFSILASLGTFFLGLGVFFMGCAAFWWISLWAKKNKIDV